MDSPSEANNRIPATSSSPASSPTVQESPFFNYLRNLSPIKSAKATKYTQRFSTRNFSSPLPVFTSPRIDLQRQNSFLKREETDTQGSDVYGQSDSQLKPLIPCFQKEVQSCSPSGCIDEFLTDPVEGEDTTNTSHLCAQRDNDAPKLLKSDFTGDRETVTEANNVNVCNTTAGVLLADQTGENLHSTSLMLAETSVYQRDDERLNKFLEFTSGNVNDPVTSDMFLDPFPGAQHHGQFVAQATCGQHKKLGASFQPFPKSLPSAEVYESSEGNSRQVSMGSVKEGGQHQRGIRRHLHFGATMACKIISNETSNTASLSLTTGLTNLKSLDGISISSVGKEIYVHVEDDQHDTQAAAAAGSVTSQSTNSTQAPSGSLHVAPFEQQAAPCEGSMPASQNTDIVDELNQVSPKRNRKRAKYTSENEGCKRCNCKRSKCLKLYCECFAAGVYCLDSCACKNCFNKPEYEDTVLDTRQQIESRNPLAFAPKVVVKHATNSPANVVEEGNWTTPSSARHKRGCNCKKSKCLKKYCECYQAGVGCSDACRCEVCSNSFGKKAGPIYRGPQRWEIPSHEQLDTLKCQSGCIKSERAHQSSQTCEEFADTSRLTPLPHPRSEAAASSALVNIVDHSKVSQAQLHEGSSLHSSASYLHWHHSPTTLAPKLCGSNNLTELGSDSFLYDILKEDDTPEILRNTPTPIKAVKAISPNKKRVSPQICSQELRSSSPQRLRSGRKFILQSVPSFPSLTPYSKLKEGFHQTDDDHQGSSSCE